MSERGSPSLWTKPNPDRESDCQQLKIYSTALAAAASPEKLPDSAAARTSFYIYAYHLHFRLIFLFDLTNTYMEYFQSEVGEPSCLPRTPSIWSRSWFPSGGSGSRLPPKSMAQVPLE